MAGPLVSCTFGLGQALGLLVISGAAAVLVAATAGLAFFGFLASRPCLSFDTGISCSSAVGGSGGWG